MSVIYKKSFISALTAVAWYVESLNTPGSGDRWAGKLLDEIEKNIHRDIDYRKCRNTTLNKLGFRCINYKDWIITYKKEECD